MKKGIWSAALMICVPSLVHAGCGDDVDAIARQYHIASALPPASQSSTSDKLAASGGVIAPPPTGDMTSTASASPVPGGDRMQTAPTISPQTAEGGAEKGAPDASTAEAAATSQAASLLQVARDAAKNGNETACRQSLADAAKLLSDTSAKSN
jgi:hypothetical protein